MLICIDSCVFIHGLQTDNPEFTHLIELTGIEYELVIPRLITLEVTRSLSTPAQIKRFYRPFARHTHARIIDEPTPRHLVEKYIGLGLREKGDAYIGAFAEWLRVDYLVTDNRHFLRELQTTRSR